MIGGFLSKILIVVVLSMGAAGFWYYSTTQIKLANYQTKIQEQQNLVNAYETRDQEQQRAIQALQDNLKLQTEALTTMSRRNAEIQSEMNRYLDIFKRHNLAKLATAKPGLVESRANNATKEVFDGIEADSNALQHDPTP